MKQRKPCVCQCYILFLNYWTTIFLYKLKVRSKFELLFWIQHHTIGPGRIRNIACLLFKQIRYRDSLIPSCWSWMNPAWSRARRSWAEGRRSRATSTVQYVQYLFFLNTIFSPSVVDPDPHGSGTFAWIRVRNNCSGSGSSKKRAPTLSTDNKEQ